MDKLKENLQTVKSDMVEFSKRYDHATQAQELTAKALEEANEQKKGFGRQTTLHLPDLPSLSLVSGVLAVSTMKLIGSIRIAISTSVSSVSPMFVCHDSPQSYAHRTYGRRNKD
ncbi:hypothetical protein Fot_34304 [Forsythia ovata]|uniref:Uncharacterized protein n=1 Tax=Forsythia ovata TaxID=205694 RepID=A0ABD1SIF9_9LAMI